ncbi:MAG: type II toxin-antitoxin system VapC family toxin [Pseudomonadota bacterium]
MKLLLDTCTFLWIISGDKALSQTAADLYADPSNSVFLSSVSSWEISVKYALGRLVLPRSPAQYIPAQREAHGIESLALAEDAVLHLPKLPDYHRDPFDRMLICQAQIHSMVILTPDDLISRYPVRCTW